MLNVQTIRWHTHKIFVHAQKLISASAYTSVCCRRRTFLGRIQPMSNVYLLFVSVYQRMTDFVHTLAYAGAIRNSVTGLLGYGDVIKVKGLFWRLWIFSNQMIRS